MKEYSNKWKGSIKPKKQRKYLKNAPLHTKRKIMSVNLSKSLRKDAKKRSIPVRKGDKVKILRGTFKGKTAKVEKVLRKDYKLLLEGITIEKKDGTKINYPTHYSNVQIVELDLNDKKRIKEKQKVK
ncbi:MAG: 50S ribosomal protein L24 [Candidatus Nanoarchaeia archaeon]|nr:50S ribosomal protein L24 [Candidatus Nanoarchaeia archaeon]